jgi:Protein NO VEIN, C-terminal
LIPRLSGRSNGSVEFKQQNISSVLVELGLPYVEGYKPRGNYQGLLATEVEKFLDELPGYLEQLAATPVLNPSSMPQSRILDLAQIIVDPPEKILAPSRTDKPWLSLRGQRLDFAERDAANRQLGKLAEEFVFTLERHRLKEAGRDDLALKVQWVAQTIGDGLGFDILSFDDADDSERMLEVKATGLGKFFPFYVTANEVRCSDDIPEQYQLFRVFDFGREPRIYILHGSLKVLCQLEPVLSRAAI